MLFLKNSLAFCLANLICIALIAQPDFRDGFVVINNGDTMRGQVEYKDWYINPQKINFKNEENRKFSFTTNDIKYFEVNKTKTIIEQFHSASMFIDETPVDYIIEDSTGKPKLKHVSYFLRYVVRGELTLFQLVDDREKKHFIVQKSGGDFKELFYKKYYAIKEKDDLSPNYVNKLAEVNKFRAQLRQLTLDCPSITDETTQRLRFEPKMIRAFVIKYNNCAHPDKISYIEPESRWQFKFWLGGGVGYSSILPITTIGRMAYINSTDFPVQLYPAISLGVQATIPKTSEKLHLCLEVSNKNYKYQNTLETPITGGTITTITNIDFSYLQPNFLIRFIPYSKNLTVGFDFGTARNNIGVFQASIDEVYPTYEREFLYQPFEVEDGESRSFVGGGFIGYKNKINLHFRYENFNIQYPETTFTMKTFYTYLTYTF